MERDQVLSISGFSPATGRWMGSHFAADRSEVHVTDADREPGDTIPQPVVDAAFEAYATGSEGGHVDNPGQELRWIWTRSIDPADRIDVNAPAPRDLADEIEDLVKARAARGADTRKKKSRATKK